MGQGGLVSGLIMGITRVTTRVKGVTNLLPKSPSLGLGLRAQGLEAVHPGMVAAFRRHPTATLSTASSTRS